VKQLFRECD